MQKAAVLSFLLLICVFVVTNAQDRPRLVVGITVDQMRYDYLYKYWNDYSERGFKRLLREGFVAHNGHFHYAPTYTGPGHASIYSGTGPAQHGIVANDWYDRDLKKTVYCAEDPAAKTVGSSSPEGRMSPRRLTANTLGDQMKLGTNLRAKTVGIALKDRGSILAMGYQTDGAYWFDYSEGRFITSNFYRERLPGWLEDFNRRNLPDQLLREGWSLLYPIERYDESLPDDKLGELPYRNTEKAVFPYDLVKISETRRFGVGEQKYNLLAGTPHGNTLTLEAAKAALIGEGLGLDEHPDLLAISLSSPDYAGHQFGPHSVEIQDMYLRLDLALADFLAFLDQRVGLRHTVVFLTADHGAADVPMLSPPGGYFLEDSFENGLRRYYREKIGADPIEYFTNHQLYFRRPLDRASVVLEDHARDYAMGFPGVMNVISLTNASRCSAEPSICEKLQKGAMPHRSGDACVQLLPGWMGRRNQAGGTTHGSPYAQDTHVPIIFMGGGIRPGHTWRTVWIEDIAPTLAALLKVPLPSGSTGTPIREVLE